MPRNTNWLQLVSVCMRWRFSVPAYPKICQSMSVCVSQCHHVTCCDTLGEWCQLLTTYSVMWKNVLCRLFSDCQSCGPQNEASLSGDVPLLTQGGPVNTFSSSKKVDVQEWSGERFWNLLVDKDHQGHLEEINKEAWRKGLGAQTKKCRLLPTDGKGLGMRSPLVSLWELQSN